MTQLFERQKLIVIGGSSDISSISRSVAQLVLQEGGSVVLIGKRAEKLQVAITELQAVGTILANRRISTIWDVAGGVMADCDQC